MSKDVNLNIYNLKNPLKYCLEIKLLLIFKFFNDLSYPNDSGRLWSLLPLISKIVNELSYPNDSGRFLS